MSPNKTLYIRDDDVPYWEQAERWAKAGRRSISQLVTTALQRYMASPSDIYVSVKPEDGEGATFSDSNGKPILEYGRHEQGLGWCLFNNLEADDSDWGDHFFPGDIDNPPLEQAREHLAGRRRAKARQEDIVIEVGEPPHSVAFVGRWLVEPDRDETRGGHDAGAYWGVALTKRGRFAVYMAHVNDRFPPSLEDFDSLDEAIEDGLPEELAAIAAAAAGETRVVWRDI